MQLTASVEVRLRRTIITFFWDQAARVFDPLAWSLRWTASNEAFSVFDAIGEQLRRRILRILRRPFLRILRTSYSFSNRTGGSLCHCSQNRRCLFFFETFRSSSACLWTGKVFHILPAPSFARSRLIHGFIHIIHQNYFRKGMNQSFADAEQPFWSNW